VPVNSADVQIVKTVTLKTALAITFSLRVTNLGPGTAQNVGVKDDLSDHVTFLTAAPTKGTCSYTGKKRRLECSLGSLTPGASATVTVHTSVRRLGDFSNKATISSSTPDPHGPNNASTVQVRVP
jgi:uncharacterized repeat protein (TIGR01451 family)